MGNPSVAVDLDADGNYAVKLSAPDWELNVTVPPAEVAELRRVQSAPWVGGSVRVGVSAGSAAFWSVGEDGRVSTLIGSDDQTWDFGVSFPMAVFEEVLRGIEALSPG